METAREKKVTCARERLGDQRLIAPPVFGFIPHFAILLPQF
jgi:hypothetical protein